MSSPAKTAEHSAAAGERLQKVLASAGCGSRRECEELILQGRVEVDREIVTELGTRVDPERQGIRVDGQRVKFSKRLYYAVNKPAGVISTSSDPSGRLRVIDLVNTDERLFAVGRLDKSSDGLMLVTNDGELANRLTHPRYGIEKTYHVSVAGHPSHEQLQQLCKGVHLAEGVARVAGIKVRRRLKHCTEITIVLREGRNREIRRLLARTGHKVLRLRRVAIGPLKLGNLPVGGHRRLTPDEVRQLRHSVDRNRRSRRGSRPKSASKSRPQSQQRGGRQPGQATRKPRR